MPYRGDLNLGSAELVAEVLEDAGGQGGREGSSGQGEERTRSLEGGGRRRGPLAKEVGWGGETERGNVRGDITVRETKGRVPEVRSEGGGRLQRAARLTGTGMARRGPPPSSPGCSFPRPSVSPASFSSACLPPKFVPLAPTPFPSLRLAASHSVPLLPEFPLPCVLPLTICSAPPEIPKGPAPAR